MISSVVRNQVLIIMKVALKCYPSILTNTTQRFWCDLWLTVLFCEMLITLILVTLTSTLWPCSRYDLADTQFLLFVMFFKIIVIFGGIQLCIGLLTRLKVLLSVLQRVVCLYYYFSHDVACLQSNIGNIANFLILHSQG